MKSFIETPEPELDMAFTFVLDYWMALTQSGESLAFPLPSRFVKPGGFFKWLFYWDAYFTLVGLVVQGEWELARELVDNFILELEHFGLIPNYNAPETVCASRSQPPFLTSMIAEVFPYVGHLDWLDRASQAAAREYHDYWTAEPHITESGLSRYIDLGTDGCLTVPDTPHFRAIAESGWDNTPRFGEDASQIIPVDLNCQLYRYEQDLAEFSEILNRPGQSSEWRVRSEHRREVINRYLWDEESGFYWDYHLEKRDRLRSSPRSTSSFVALWSGVANESQAARMFEHLSALEYDHGLVSCEKGWDDETEHNYPTGWAYSHWYVVQGLRRYGYESAASRIAMKWLRLIAKKHAETGAFRERYNVVNPDEPVPGRYPPQRGFAWTNGVFAGLLARIIFGVEIDQSGGQAQIRPSFPREWLGHNVKIHLPTYPWPDGAEFDGIAE
jgi:alpha,alpha-trehalase